jgi:hypothetical protein
MRLAHVFELYDQGRKKEAEGKLEEMAALYDEVLTYSPLFEERDKLTPGYLALAKKLESNEPERAILLLRKVERLSLDEKERNAAESQRHLLEARALAKSGVVDQGLVDKAIALDPENSAARSIFSTLTASGPDRSRYVLAALTGCVSLGFGIFALISSLRRRKDAHQIREQESTASGLSSHDAPAEPASSGAAAETLLQGDGSSDDGAEAPLGGESTSLDEADGHEPPQGPKPQD